MEGVFSGKPQNYMDEAIKPTIFYATDTKCISRIKKP
jgi:hypothetical protein